ncbi:flagellar export chaperone FliS [Sporolactobacillus vineae]|uniref:flagellar export chaperone FliS n=1 Tax=Sporolactobacillus vineae TaxID=444463 RepID=UPI0002891C9A|nr:flagellar export chaperone FliS [Sporolactobacillus vineae]
MPNNAYKVYQQNSVLTATPGELTLLLFNGCLKFIRQGRGAILNKNYEQKNKVIQKAQAIITELMVSLDSKQPVAKDMMSLYDYIHRRLIEANVKNDITILDEVEKLVADFRDTWKQVIIINRKEQGKNHSSMIRV